MLIKLTDDELDALIDMSFFEDEEHDSAMVSRLREKISDCDGIYLEVADNPCLPKLKKEC